MASSNRPRVLVTGATGYIASQLLPTFRERYDLRLVDVRTTDRDGNPVPGAQIADLVGGPAEAIRPLFAGCDAVVHLAYHRGSPCGVLAEGHQRIHQVVAASDTPEHCRHEAGLVGRGWQAQTGVSESLKMVKCSSARPAPMATQLSGSSAT